MSEIKGKLKKAKRMSASPPVRNLLSSKKGSLIWIYNGDSRQQRPIWTVLQYRQVTTGHLDQHSLDAASKSHLLQNCKRGCQSYSQWIPTNTMAPNVINREQSLDSNSDTSSPTEGEKSMRKHRNPMPMIVIISPDNAFDHLLPDGPQYSSYPYHCSQQRYWRSKKATFLFCIVIMVLLALFCITIIATTNLVRQAVQSGRHRGPQPLIRTSCGPVKGEYQDGTWVFRGIPYAMPPVGHQRWKPPSSNQMPNGRCWKETHLATSYPSVCFQMDSKRGKVIGSEDCLYLNVWMPQSYDNKKPKLPVVVMMQGEGQSFDKDTPQKSFEFNQHYVNKAQAIFVSVNYRLDIFGFLATQNLSGKRRTENVTGNFGLMDQILSLEWIRKNIEHFGGNHSQVTVYGESSGTETMLGLLTSPKAHGLFQRMLAINPAFLPIQSFPQAVSVNNNIFSHTGCFRKVGCLMTMRGEELMMAAAAHRLANRNRFRQILDDDDDSHSLSLIIDGKTLVSDVGDNTQIKEKGPRVPVMIGFSNWRIPCSGVHLEENFTSIVQSKFNLNAQSAEEIIKMYTPQKNRSSAEIIEEMLFDIKMCHAQNLLSNANFPVYYSIIRPHTSLQEDRKDDSPSAQSPDTNNTVPIIKCSEQSDKIAHSLFLSELQQLWKEGFSLIKTGRPSTSKVPNTTALISDNVITIEANYHQRECAFWSQHKIV